MSEVETQQLDEIDVELLHPGKYKVVVQNDDVTPMDFVIAMLMQVFKHDEDWAVKLTHEIHNEGNAVAGIYTYEIAEQKGIEATLLARQHGWPLAIKIEEE